MIWHRVGEEWVSGAFAIEIVGENASAKPILWGLKENGAPIMIKGLKVSHQRVCDSVTEAKSQIEVIYALRQERNRVRNALKKLEADCRCGNFDMNTILAAITR